MKLKLKSFIAKIYSVYTSKKIKKWSREPRKTQEAVLKNLIEVGRNTLFGEDHNFNAFQNYQGFKNNVPLRDYEGIKPYIEKILEGDVDVLWPGKPIYLSKTSGTTSGAKFIPITKDSISNHINCARNALLSYIADGGNPEFLEGRMIFLSGSPQLDYCKVVPTGRLSGIVNHHVPSYLKRNQLPTWETNIIDDWEEKVDKIVNETLNEDMRLISGIPPWVCMYFDKIKEKNSQPIAKIFKNLSLLVHGGVNFEPYRAKLENQLGKKIDTLETYPASEGFIAFQDKKNNEGLLLVLNEGIFYEFVPVNEIHNDNPTRLMIDEVELGVQYAIILNTNAGLWGYIIGDTVKFVSKEPYRLVVTGRIKHFISAFGEHVIAEEVDDAIAMACNKFNIKVSEYTVAPQVNPKNGLPYHEWFVEFEEVPDNLEEFAIELNKNLCLKNSYYKDLIEGNILTTLKITPIFKNGFEQYMKSLGKLGGQNKLPRLSNDRKIAEGLQLYQLYLQINT